MNPERDHLDLKKNLYEHMYGTAWDQYLRCTSDGIEDCCNESPRKEEIRKAEEAAVGSHENAKNRRSQRYISATRNKQ